MHWKVVAMIGRNDHQNPSLYAVEFDSEQAADEAAAFYHEGGYHVRVIVDDDTAIPTRTKEEPEVEQAA